MLPTSTEEACKNRTTAPQFSHMARVGTAPLHTPQLMWHWSGPQRYCFKKEEYAVPGTELHFLSGFMQLTHRAPESERCCATILEINDFADPWREVGVKKHLQPSWLCKSVPARRAPGGVQHLPPPRESMRVQVLTVSSGLTFRRNTTRTFVFSQQRLLQSIIIAHPRVQTHKDLIYSAKYTSWIYFLFCFWTVIASPA